MNRLPGEITHIESNGHVTLVDVVVGMDTLTATLLETPQPQALACGDQVAVLFKETEVSLAKHLSGLISLRNRIKATITQIRRGDILSEVTLASQAQHVITSIITTRAVNRLALAPGDEVEALIKANEVSLMRADDGL